MKRLGSILLAAIMILNLAACGGGSAPKDDDTNDTATTSNNGGDSGDGGGENVTITVVSSFGGEDGNRQNFLDYIEKYEQETGNTVKESGSTADEAWKAQVQTDFEAGSEPDVLFYFNGVNSDAFIEQNKVVSIDEIRAEYPDYGANMKDELLGASPLDGKNYSIPFVGFWEAMFVSNKVLDEVGVEMPGSDYTWDQFLADCEKIKEAGYTPIAASIHQTPHYWFEFAVMNNGGPEGHLEVPTSEDDPSFQAWVDALNDIKDLYERGYFADNTLTASDEETFQMMAEGEAAFAIDGSWKIGWFDDNTNTDDFSAVSPPSKDARKTTDMIGGISMGYYITRKAWDDPTKRDACIKFVEIMTNDEATSAFANAGNITALKNGTSGSANASGLMTSVIEMNTAATSITGAVQDNISDEQRDNLFGNVKNVATGTMTAEEAVLEMINK